VNLARPRRRQRPFRLPWSAVVLLVLTPVLVPGLPTKGASFVLSFVPPQVQHYSASPSRRHLQKLYGRSRNQQASCTPILRATTTLWSQQSPKDLDSDEQQQQPPPQDIWVIHWEGCVVDTVPWRIQTGVETAATAATVTCRGISVVITSSPWLSNQVLPVARTVWCPPSRLSN
jgi:hypothetical protein